MTVFYIFFILTFRDSLVYYPQIVSRDMRTDCVGRVPISQWASPASLAEIFSRGWDIHSFGSTLNTRRPATSLEINFFCYDLFITYVLLEAI